MTAPAFRYLDVCAGISALSVAARPLGWECAGYSEIEAFPRAVLQERFGAVPVDWDHRHAPGQNSIPLFGDFTRIEAHHVGSIDLFWGGTPCQDFSIAGLRKGLAGDRGNLTLEFVRLADRLRPRWVGWENVPGILSQNKGRAFGTFLGALGELGYGFAYRVLDAQFCRVDRYARAVPQRRRRVILVGYLGDWRRAAAVLFDRKSLSGNPAPRRQAGQGVAGTLKACSGISGTPNGAEEVDRLICMAHGQGGAEIMSDGEPSLTCNHEAPILAHAIQAGALRENPSSGPDGVGVQAGVAYTLEARSEVQAVAHALRGEGFDASEDGTGRGVPLVPIAFTAKDYGADAGEVCPTLRGGGHSGSHANGGVMPAIAFPKRMSATQHASAVGVSPALGATNPTAVAFDLRGREGGAQFEGPHDTANIRAASGGSSRSYVAQQWAVRRLMPVECERLQGFPDGWTDVPYRRKPAADGPRYKALGNSMAINVIEAVMTRLATVDAIPPDIAAPK